MARRGGKKSLTFGFEDRDLNVFSNLSKDIEDVTGGLSYLSSEFPEYAKRTAQRGGLVGDLWDY